MVRIASKATKGKGKRWFKGQSSSSIPETRKHRTKAQQALASGGSVFKQSSTGQQKGLVLTRDLLTKYDAIQKQKQRMESGGVENWIDNTVKVNLELTENGGSGSSSSNEPMQHDDTKSLGAVSAASVWTQCTNVSFDRFLNGLDIKSSIHKSMLSVLATVREAIEAQGGKETETEYFAALMMALNCVQSEEKLTATVALIRMVLHRVPPSVLRLKFGETVQDLLRILADQCQSAQGNIYLIKSLIGCVGILLKHQERAVWELTSTQKVFETLLSLLVHNKPRVRKAANFTLISIICQPQPEGSPPQVANKLAAEFSIKKLEDHLTTTLDAHLNIVLYVLGFLADILPFFPNSLLTKRACETILSHMTLGNVLIVSASLQTVYSLFMRRPLDSVLSPELNARLINALYDYMPNVNDDQLLNAWVIGVKEGLLCLNSKNEEIASKHLVVFTKTMVGCLASDSGRVHECCSNAVRVVFKELVVDAEGKSKRFINLKN